MAGRSQTRTEGGYPAQGALTTQRVRTAALEILDEEGLEALSMRRVAEVLGRKAMSLYRYARNKAALLDGVVELVLSELSIDPTADDWPQELRDLADDYQRLTLAHPHVVPLLVTLPKATPLGLRPAGTIRLLEDFLGLLTRAGLPPSDALHTYRLFFGFLHGHALGELQETVEDRVESEDLLRLALHRLPRRDFPQVRELASDLSGYDGATHLRQGVDMMITSLESRLQPVRALP